MKRKIYSVVTIMLMFVCLYVCMVNACAEKLIDNVYWFKIEQEPFKTFSELVDGWSEVIDGRYYLIDSDAFICDEYSSLTLKELEDALNEKLNQVNACSEAHVYMAGEGVVHVQINGVTDLVSLDTEEIFGTGETIMLKDMGAKVYGCDWLVWASYNDAVEHQ